MVRFDGKRNPERRDAVERGEDVYFKYEDGSSVQLGFVKWRKTAPTYAVQIPVPFEVDTLEGLHSAKEYDFLVIGAAGEMYPVAQDIFANTYQRDTDG